MPSPFVVEVCVEPKDRADRSALKRALDGVLESDRTLSACADADTAHFMLRAPDECRLNAAVDRLRRDLQQRIDVARPHVAYCESLVRAVDVDLTHKKQSGGSGQFGRVRIAVKPGARGQGVIFEDQVTYGGIPGKFISSVEKGIREAAATGPLAGFPIIDFTATLHDGSYHDMDSSALAFEIAARGAMREAAWKAGSKLLEPIMKVVVLTQNCWLDAVVAGLAARRATIESRSEGRSCVIVAFAPMAELFGYRRAVASVSQDEARSTMLFDHYAEVPPDLVSPGHPSPPAAALRA